MPTTTHNELLHNVALSLVPQIGPGNFKNIVSYSGSAHNFFNMTKGRASKIPGIGPKLLELRSNKDTYLREAEKTIREANDNGIQIHSYLEDTYPQRLKSLPDSPVIIFSKGNIDLNPSKTIGIVGTRNATAYGKAVTKKILEDLAPYSPTVISGLAYGIDIEAHRAALQFDLPTLAVLGSDLKKIYPASHKRTAEQMMENGGLISEYRLGAALNASNFPQRNRIIAGMSDALIVVEAAERGGALITAEIAYSYNREVFAVPGNLQSTYSEGCNNLIRSMKAGIYIGAREIEEALSWNKEGGNPKADKKVFDTSGLDPVEKQIIEVLSKANEIEIDRLSWETNLPISVLAGKLLSLEFSGIIKALPGKKYRWQPDKRTFI
ncbi:DNA-processing protein DprA [Negadavirga shengliensis]|uniref:DNA-processing protein DprA n=1 Tax=Negadavirga shengliensis TaxID=1389218 RepID=A0ABV9T2C7_9BACT